MSGRDRLVVAIVVLVIVLVVGWTQVVSPERSKVSTAEHKIESARSALTSAQSELQQAQQAKAAYRTAYAAIVALGKAVPASQEIPSLLYEVEAASEHHHVDLLSVSATSATSTAPTTGAAASAQSFQQLPFTFTFEGTYADLYNFLKHVQEFAAFTPPGLAVVHGRLLTIDSLNLAPAGGSAASSGKTKGHTLSGTITATAYVLPAGETLTEGATPTAPRPLPGTSSSNAAGVPATIKGLP